jgi:RNA polymerase sigma-70 factor (ECF subfamily)
VGQPPEDREDEELLVAAAGGDGGAYAAFYRRFERAVLSYFARAGAAPDVRADLTAETFARALAGIERFDPALGRPAAWLFGIARHVLLASYERGRVESAARRRLSMPPLLLDDEAIDRIDEISAAAVVVDLLAALPAEQRTAIEARIVLEREYADIARDLQCSEQVVRKRVSRGLAALRHQLEEKP